MKSFKHTQTADNYAARGHAGVSLLTFELCVLAHRRPVAGTLTDNLRSWSSPYATRMEETVAKANA